MEYSSRTTATTTKIIITTTFASCTHTIQIVDAIANQMPSKCNGNEFMRHHEQKKNETKNE